MKHFDMVMVGSYDYRLVALSVFIAILASYAALDLAGRVTSAQGRARLFWLSGGAVAMGIGIWSMHYVGMLAFRLPVPVQYDWPTVLLSLLAAIFASLVGLFVVGREKMGKIELESIDLHLPVCLELTLKTLALLAHGKGLELIFDVAPEVPEIVRGDSNRL